MPKPEEKLKQGTTHGSTKDAHAKFFASAPDQLEHKREDSMNAPSQESSHDQWLSENFGGQLAVDVYQTEKNIVIQSTVAGVRVEDIDISVNNDMVTIRGIRKREHEVRPENFFYQECYWGGFSRSIILPFDVKAEKVTATLKNGILTITLPKVDKSRSKSIRVHEELDEDES